MPSRSQAQRFRYEHRTQALLPRGLFLKRVATHAAIAAAFLLASLLAGILGYRFLAGLTWIDALLNASMILAGMGPVDNLTSDSAKLFASIYALYSGVAFLAISALIFAPFAHRLLHRLHLEESGD